jgi:hypothetical protein
MDGDILAKDKYYYSISNIHITLALCNDATIDNLMFSEIQIYSY